MSWDLDYACLTSQLTLMDQVRGRPSGPRGRNCLGLKSSFKKESDATVRLCMSGRCVLGFGGKGLGSVATNPASTYCLQQS